MIENERNKLEKAIMLVSFNRYFLNESLNEESKEIVCGALNTVVEAAKKELKRMYEGDYDETEREDSGDEIEP